jgi:hypothetical protein
VFFLPISYSYKFAYINVIVLLIVQLANSFCCALFSLAYRWSYSQ